MKHSLPSRYACLALCLLFTFASLPLHDAPAAIGYARQQKRFNAELAFGRRLEPWFVELHGRDDQASTPR